MENSISHPSIYIDAEDVATIRNTAADAEQLGMLHPNQLTIVYQQKWFRLLVPQIYGGVQITLPELVRLQEAISWADGSMGWVVTLCSGAGWFGGFLSPQIAQQVFNDAQVCLAGSGAVSGTATITPNGYILNGTWNYASGAHHASHITANCTIKNEDGETLLDQENKPLVLPFIVDKKDVTLLPTWKYMGMVATGSHSFQVKNLEVPADRSFKIDAGYTTVDGELYKYPFLQLAYATLAVNLSGMAIHFTDLCEAIFAEKKARVTDVQAAKLQEIFTEQTGKLQLARLISLQRLMPHGALRRILIVNYTP
jgi:alkylation response protein AidB-like acyl-CoA dehydrogenase